MPLADILLPEFDHEMATTRALLAVLPDDQFAWKPHPRSMSLGVLAAHLATNPGWLIGIVGHPSYDLAPGGVEVKEPVLPNRAAVLATFDGCVAGGRAALAGMTDAQAQESWSLLWNGHPIHTATKVVTVRTWVLSHLIHHRGQLSVYLRLLNVPVPGIYGPSADTMGG